jgi:hypothetical protein
MVWLLVRGLWLSGPSKDCIPVSCFSQALILDGDSQLASLVSPSRCIPVSQLAGPSKGVNKQRWGCIPVSCFFRALILSEYSRLASLVTPGSCIPISRLSAPSQGVNKQRRSCRGNGLASPVSPSSSIRLTPQGLKDLRAQRLKVMASGL